jgi:phosphatidylglycerophosphatase C
LKQIAFFDFDGTITTKDSFLELIKFQKGKARFYFGFLINAPLLILYKLKIISNQKAKEQMLRFFFKNMSHQEFQHRCNLFAELVLPGFIRPKALHEIKKLSEKNIEIVIVSASAGSWIKKWSDTLNVALIATVLEERNDVITGKIDGKNCYGEEKVNRIRSLYDLSEYDKIYCYGDTTGDQPMLAIGTNSYYKPFR